MHLRSQREYEEHINVERKVIETAAFFFNVPSSSIRKKTSVYALAHSLHDPVLFSFEIEKQFGIELDDEEMDKTHTIASYILIVKKHLRDEGRDSGENLRKVA